MGFRELGNRIGLAVFFLATCVPGLARGEAIGSAGDAAVQKGFEFLVGKNYVPSNLNQEVFDNLWRVWEEPARANAEKASPQERRNLTLSRYGLTDLPGREGTGAPLQYADENGKWATNCFICHGGKVAGKVIPGLPNSHVALATLFHEIHQTKTLLGQKVGQTEVGSLIIPLGNSNGTTNAIIFGVLLAAFRDHDLNFHPEHPVPKMIHNDHDAPPWWHYKHKKFLYADGFAGKGHRALMQFMMTPENNAKFFYDNEEDFKYVEKWIAAVEPPKYPFEIDSGLAAKGEKIFNANCSECHGTYGDQASWPGKIVPIEEVGTDRARLDSLKPWMRTWYKDSWFGQYGDKDVVADPGGYVAQPLDGIWATAPYLHNGSVPTLWHLFHADARPVVWKRTEDGYDRQKVGLEIEEFDALPADVKRIKEKRTYFDSRILGKGKDGHTFPEALSEDEKTAVIEYLKTL